MEMARAAGSNDLHLKSARDEPDHSAINSIRFTTSCGRGGSRYF